MDPDIEIGCSSNDSYCQHLGVMIYSLLKNCSCPERIKINLMDGSIKKENKDKLNSIIKRFGAKIKYLKPNLKKLEGLKECRHITLESYYRFDLIDNIKSNKVLYLDADMIILADIKTLWENKFNKNIIFAIKDPGGSNKKKEKLGITLNKNYFNAGVLLIDCKKWKKENISKKAIEYMKENPEKIEYADQDGLNAVLKDTWQELNPQWNLITRLVYYKYLPFLKVPNYENEDLKNIIKNPKIIHYASFIKPWFFIDPSPFKKVYWDYLKETPWKDYKQPDKTFSGFFKRVNYYLRVVIKKF